MKNQRESSIEDKVVTYALKRGIFGIKMKIGSGWPDRLYPLPGGRQCWQEYKLPGEEPKPRQGERLAYLKALGHDAEWFDDAAAAIRHLTQALDAASRSETRD